jgi:hypothetical protein
LVDSGLCLIECGAAGGFSHGIIGTLQQRRNGMAYRGTVVALALILASTSTAVGAAPAKDARSTGQGQAQAVKYCVIVEPFTGSRVSKTECKTREQWAREGVDVDALKKP